MDTKKIFETRATLHPGQNAAENNCERCGDPVNSNCKCTGEGLVKKLSGSLVV